jgi:hypothetical protein
VSFIAPTLLPSKGDLPGQAPRPREVVVAEPEAVPDVELVSLEEVAAGEEDEAAAIADVDLGEEEPVAGEEEDTFLEEEEEEGSVTGYLDTGPAPKEGEEEP